VSCFFETQCITVGTYVYVFLLCKLQLFLSQVNNSNGADPLINDNINVAVEW